MVWLSEVISLCWFICFLLYLVVTGKTHIGDAILPEVSRLLIASVAIGGLADISMTLLFHRWEELAKASSMPTSVSVSQGNRYYSDSILFWFDIADGSGHVHRTCMFKRFGIPKRLSEAVRTNYLPVRDRGQVRSHVFLLGHGSHLGIAMGFTAAGWQFSCFITVCNLVVTALVIRYRLELHPLCIPISVCPFLGAVAGLAIGAVGLYIMG